VSRNRKLIAGGIAAAVVAAGVVVWAVSGGGSSTKSNELVVFARVQRRPLQNTVSLNGTLARKEIRNITSGAQGLVSAVYRRTARRRVQATRCLRSMVVAPSPKKAPCHSSGRWPPATRGRCDQLKQILAGSGDYPGAMDNQFTQQTQFALAQWQAQHHYPNSTPASPSP